MSEDRRVKPEDIMLRSVKNRIIADVSGGEEYVDARVDDAATKKKAEKVWDSSKDTLREIAAEAVDILEEQDKNPAIVNLLGSENAIIEVAQSTRRKKLPDLVLDEVKATDLSDLVQEEVTVTLKGDLATWAIAQLSEHAGSSDFSVKRQTVLKPEFEGARFLMRKAKQHTALLHAMSKAGLFSPSVEAKIQKG